MPKKKSKQAILIGSRLVSDNEPAFIIAEIGINHNGKVAIAKKLIDAAVEARVDAVKFQMRHLNNLYTKDAIKNTKNEDIGTQYLLTLIKDARLARNDFDEIVKYCKARGILFLCTPWDKESVNELERYKVPAYKIASADLTNFELLEYVASKGKPMIISTGMSSVEEIKTSIGFLDKLNAHYILLHCNSSYPSQPKDLSLRFIQKLKEMNGGGIVGYSGHELGTATTLATIPLGAKVIERHITLNRTMKGPDHAVSLEPKEFVGLVRDIRNIELALKMSSKYVTRGEYINRKILSKSLVAAVAIRKGQILIKNMITVKSPAKGLSPQKLYDMIGRRSVRDMKKDEYFTDSDLGIKPTPHNTVLKGKWGLIVRPNDYEKIITDTDPKCIEFHLSFHDLKYPFKPKKPVTAELIIHAPELWGTTLLDLCSKDRKMVSESVKNINILLDQVRMMRKHFTKTPKNVKVVLHPGGMSYRDFVNPTEKEEMYRTLAQSLQQLDLKGIDLLLENLPPFPWYKGGQWFSNVFTDAQEMADFSRKYGYNLCYDTSHAQLYCTFAGKDAIEFFKIVKPFVHHIHLSDGTGTDGEGLQIGDGDVLWEKIIPEIKKADVTFTPEIWMGHRHGGEGFWMALKKLKKYKL